MITLCTAFFFIFASIIQHTTVQCTILILQSAITPAHTVDKIAYPCYTEIMNVPKIHPLAKSKNGVRFSEIEKYSVLLYAHTGIWENIIREQMPAVHVILQENRDSFEALKRESALLSFSTELSARHYGGGENAIQIPITDESATLTFYCHILKKNKAALKEFIEKYQ